MSPGSVHEMTLRQELEALGLWDLLQDPDHTDVVVNADGTVHVAGFGGARVSSAPLPAEKLSSCIATIAGIHGRLVGEERPVLEVSLPFSRVRVTAIMPPVTTAPVLALRIPPRRLLTLRDLEERGSIDPEAARLLVASLEEGQTVVVAGAVSSGKTVLASALLAALLERRPELRLVVLEEGAREVHLPDRSNVSRLLTPSVAELPMRDLLRVSLRLNPDRIVVGELRGVEALDFLKASVSGHPGLATLHATSAVDAIARMGDLVEEAGVPPSPARVARSVRLVVHMARARAERRVREILRLEPPNLRGEFATEVLYRAQDRAGRDPGRTR